MQAVLFLLLMQLSLIAETTYRGEGGTVSFSSDAPLELIEAESDALTGIVNGAENTFAFLVPTKTLKGFNSPLQQEHFHENYMESQKYPTASFSGKFIEDISKLEIGEHTVRAKGMLKIHGEEVERIIKCSLSIMEKGLMISSNFSVPLSDHNISIPQVVNQKIAELIEVNVQLKLKPQ